MNRNIALAVLLAAALAGCEWGKSTSTSAGAACTTVSGACTKNSDCCSYACQGGFCTANPVDGGICKTSDDCAFARLCKSGKCTTPTFGMCRDNADVCSYDNACCSGNCVIPSLAYRGSCEPNHAPVAAFTVTWVQNGTTASMGTDGIVPMKALLTLQNGSTDPDGDPLTYGWVLTKPTGSIAALSSTTAPSPTFTPDLAGTYLVQLTVTDGPTTQPGRMTSTVAYTLLAVNVPPVATVKIPADTVWPNAPAGTWSRNVPITVTGSTSDPDGDNIRCAWRVTAPGATPAPVATLTFAACANPTPSISTTYTATAEGLYTVDLVVQDLDTANNPNHTTIATGTFTSRNDAPTPVVKPDVSTAPNPPATAPSPFYSNLGPPGGTNPTVTLDASLSWDRNGDTPLAYEWQLVSAADGQALPPFTNSGQVTQSFIPARATDYVVSLTVSDPVLGTRAAASAAILVTVKVGRYVQPLAHDFADVAYAKSANKIVTAGHDPADARKGMVWVYDVATATESSGISLVDASNASGIPKLVGVTPDGTRIVAVDWVTDPLNNLSGGVSVWVVSIPSTWPTSGTPTVSQLTRPFDVGEVVVAGARYAYLLPVTSSASSYAIRQLDLQNPTSATALTTTSMYGSHAASSSGTTLTSTWFYRTEPTWGDLYRYTVNNNGTTPLNPPTTNAYFANGFTCGGVHPAFWATLDNQYLVTACGSVYNASTGASIQTLQNGSAQTVLPPWVDSTTAGPVLAVDAARTSLHRYSGTLMYSATDVLPRWGLNGVGHTASALKAFFNSDGSKRIAVVSDTATTKRYGVITYP